VAIQNPPSEKLIITNSGGGKFIISGTGTPDYTYRLQYSDTAAPFSWQDLSSVTADSTTGEFEYTDTAGAPTRFYRTAFP